MSYKSLLFCSDEKSARLVTQVLSELDFTVELAADTYATAKKLAEEHFDAIVVDCHNEQDASLLFKAARNSTENHSSLSVAVVEGQAGVAKAFRIGANLVLTKPINVEQSKGTLRVARGLLKKNQAKAGEGTAPTPVSTFSPSAPKPAVPAAVKPTVPSTPAFTSVPSPLPSSFNPAPAAAAAHASAQDVPYAGLELDKEPTPTPEAADAAVLDSLPQLPVAKAPEPSVAPFKPMDKPFIVGASAGAAAPAPAMDKKVVEHQVTGMSPMVTNEPIIREPGSPVVADTHSVPTFASLDSRPKQSGGSKGFLMLLLALVVLGAAFYFGWQKLPGLLHRKIAAQQIGGQPATSGNVEAPVAQSSATQPSTTQPGTISGTPQSAPSLPTANDSSNAPAASEQIAATTSDSTAGSSAAPGNIEIQEMPFSRDAKVTVTPKAQPLVVRNDAKPSEHRAVTPVAPSLDMTATQSNSPIADLVTSNAPLPKPAPGTIRISQGVSQGLLVKKVSPSYPSIALQLHKEGTVEMLATVSKDGHIANVKVLSGDALLARAATEAVKQWQYRPYLLNGQPLEVETQISISFKLPK